jgi:hypothetical protein
MYKELGMEGTQLVSEYLAHATDGFDFPSVPGYQLFSGILDVSDEEMKWILVGQRDWIIREISTDESLTSITKLTEIRALMEQWGEDGEEEDSNE